MKTKLGDLIEEYSERNVDNKYKPVAVGKYGVRARESIYTKELAKDYSKNKLIYKGTLTVGMGSNQIDIGILRDDEIYSVSPAYHTYKIKIPNYDYLDYLLAANNNRMFSIYANRGSRQGKTLDLKRWLTDELCLHDEKDQKIIVHTLNTVKQLINQKEAELVKLDNLIKARFVEMFSCDKGNIKKLSELTETITKGTTPTTAGFSFEDDGINFFKIESITNDHRINLQKVAYVNEECHSTFKRSQLKEGDVLFSIAGAIGRTAIIRDKDLPGNTNQALAIIRLKANSNVSRKYLISALESPEVVEQYRKKKRGVAQMNLSLQDIGNISIPVPNSTKQSEFEKFAKQVDKSKFALVKSIKLLKSHPLICL